MNLSWATDLLLAAGATNGIAAGATLDQSIKQPPARRRIGAPAYLGYVRAADMSNGLIWYPIMGIGTALVTLAAVIIGLLAHPTAVGAVALAAAGAGTLAHTAATSRADPVSPTPWRAHRRSRRGRPRPIRRHQRPACRRDRRHPNRHDLGAGDLLKRRRLHETMLRHRQEAAS